MTSEFSNNGDGAKTDATKGSSGTVNVDGITASAAGLVKMAGLSPGKAAEVMDEVKDKVEKVKEVQENNEKKKQANEEINTTTTGFNLGPILKKDEKKLTPTTLYIRVGNSWAGKDGTISDGMYCSDIQVGPIRKRSKPNVPDTVYVKDDSKNFNKRLSKNPKN